MPSQLLTDLERKNIKVWLADAIRWKDDLIPTIAEKKVLAININTILETKTDKLERDILLLLLSYLWEDVQKSDELSGE